MLARELPQFSQFLDFPLPCFTFQSIWVHYCAIVHPKPPHISELLAKKLKYLVANSGQEDELHNWENGARSCTCGLRNAHKHTIPIPREKDFFMGPHGNYLKGSIILLHHLEKPKRNSPVATEEINLHQKPDKIKFPERGRFSSKNSYH